MIEDGAAPLVGRHTQIEMLDRALRRTGDGRFAVVEISGEPGTGKTRMLAELARRASSTGLRVLAGSATEFDRAVPFGIYLEALQPAGTAGEGAGEGVGELDGVLGALRDEASASGPGPAAGWLRLHAGVRRLLAGGVALLLDDLQLADPASLALTEHLLRKPPRGPALIAVTFRDAWTHCGIIDATGRLGVAAFRMGLPPLRSDDLKALLPDLPDHRRALILRASRGNPLYVQSLAGMGDAALGALARDRDLSGTDCPDGPAQHLLARPTAEITALSPVAQQVARAAAVVGDRAAIDLVAHVAQLPLSTVVESVDQMHQAGLASVDGVWFQFRHPLLRAAAHRLAGPAWRVEAHRRTAAWLLSHGGAVDVRAHHTQRSALPGDDAAAKLLVDAARGFTYAAPAEAARWLGTALRIMPDTDAWRERRPGVVLRYAHTLALAGELRRSADALRQSLPEDGPPHPRALAIHARLARHCGDLDEAAARLASQVSGRPLSPAAEGIRQIELAAVALLDADAASAADHGERAHRRLGSDRPEVAAAHALRAWAAFDGGDPAAAGEHAASAAALADAASDVALHPWAELFSPLAWVELHLGRLAAAEHHLTRAKELVERVGQGAAMPYLLIVEGAVRTRRGQLAPALALLDEAAAAARLIGSRELAALADAVRLRPLIWAAGPAAAIEAAGRLAAAGGPRSGLARRITQLNVVVAQAVATGAVARLDLISAGSASRPVDPHTVVTREAMRAMVSARRGDLAAAQKCADQADATATTTGLDYERGLAAYAKGHVAMRADRLDEAAALAVVAVAWFGAAGTALDAALARQLAADVYGRAGREERSRDELDRARAGFLTCGATWLLATAPCPSATPRPCAASRPEARGADVPKPPGVETAGVETAGVETAGGLTVREREIAHLVATGMSNRAIASHLFLSRRTVETHVSRIFTKLDVHSRVQLANRLRGSARTREMPTIGFPERGLMVAGYRGNGLASRRRRRQPSDSRPARP